MRLLLTGGSGRLGRALRQVATSFEITAPPRAQLDLSHPETVGRAVREAHPDWVIHAGALTDVERCEREPELAACINAQATGALAKAAEAAGARMLYVSTDYVFDGRKGAYREGDEARPLSVYGRTKLEGERRVAAALPDAVVARTAVVFGTPGCPDFLSWVAGEAKAGRPMRIASDQRTSPTYSYDLARQVLALIEAGAKGIYHTAGAEALTRMAMAQTVADILGIEADLQPVPMSQLPWKAPRPADSSLDVGRISALVAPMPFRDAAAEYLEAWQ